MKVDPLSVIIDNQAKPPAGIAALVLSTKDREHDQTKPSAVNEYFAILSTLILISNAKKRYSLYTRRLSIYNRAHVEKSRDDYKI